MYFLDRQGAQPGAILQRLFRPAKARRPRRERLEKAFLGFPAQVDDVEALWRHGGRGRRRYGSDFLPKGEKRPGRSGNRRNDGLERATERGQPDQRPDLSVSVRQKPDAVQHRVSGSGRRGLASFPLGPPAANGGGFGRKLFSASSGQKSRV